MTEWLHVHALEKTMATHSSILAWRIPGTEEPGGLPSMGSHRVGHDWSDLAAAAAAMALENFYYYTKSEFNFFCGREDWGDNHKGFRKQIVYIDFFSGLHRNY